MLRTKLLLRELSNRRSTCAAAFIFVSVALFSGFFIFDSGNPISPSAQEKQVAKKDPTPVSGVTTQFLVSELIDLHLKKIAVTHYVKDFKPGAGAIELIGEQIVVAEQSGGFVLISDTEKVSARRLAAKLEINAGAMISYLKKNVPDLHSIAPNRITDLLYIKSNNSLAVAHSYWHIEKRCMTIRVVTTQISDLFSLQSKSPDIWKKIFESQPCRSGVYGGRQSGGRIILHDENKLLLTVGDTGLNDPANPDLRGDYGKIVEIDLDNGKYHHVTEGHRNTQGLTIDSSGRIWSTEHGPQGGDELNLITQGRHYGWPHVTFGLDYGSRTWPHSDYQGRHDGYEKPVFAWLPSIGVSNIVQANGFHNRWNGDLLVTSLRDRSIHRLRTDNERVVYEERVLVGERIRDAVMAKSGALFLWSDKGNILKINAVDASVSTEQKISMLPSGVAQAIRRCVECHGLEKNSGSRGKISLFGIYRNRVAKGPRKLYSKSVLNYSRKNVSWETWRLNKFLRNPDDLVPDSDMSDVRIESEPIRTGVIEFLKTLR